VLEECQIVNLSNLTLGERLLLERRRREESQQQAARRLRVSRYRYRAWEGDEQCDEVPPRAPLRLLREHEACFLRRRRAGVSVAALARALGTSPWWLTQMERGRAPIARLRAHWAGIERKAPRGPRFGRCDGLSAPQSA